MTQRLYFIDAVCSATSHPSWFMRHMQNSHFEAGFLMEKPHRRSGHSNRAPSIAPGVVTEMLWPAHAREILVREHARKKPQRQRPANGNIPSAPGSNMPIYRPHEGSPSAAEIIWTIARESKACCDFIDNGESIWTAQAPPADPPVILSAFQTQYTALGERIGRLNESTWQNKTKLFIDGQLFRESLPGRVSSTPSITAAS